VAVAFARPERSRSGFTLLELLVVIGVLGILTTIAVPMIRSGQTRAAIARSRGELAALSQALESYRQHYGDYPQTGNAAQATPVVSADVAATQAQALLFNALIGVYGPTDFATSRNGPMLIELSKFRVEETRDYTTRITQNSVGVATGSPPIKQRIASAFLDPWGNRYLYYYKPAPLGGRPPANTWRPAGFVLYSAGPDGQHTAPNIATGLFTGTAQTTGTNADNLYANP
jgi:prepilin-type N-terminal cleavage/methylation domain-containing protein